jgi:hypothetical protein
VNRGGDYPLPFVGTPPQPSGPDPGASGPTLALPPSPSASSLCTFKFPPTLQIKLGFKLPSGGIQIPPPLPKPHLGLALNCSSSNPLAVQAGLGWAAGRAPNAPPDPDLQEQAQYVGSQQ